MIINNLNIASSSLMKSLPNNLMHINKKKIDKSLYNSKLSKKFIVNKEHLVNTLKLFSNDCKLVKIKGTFHEHFLELYFDTPDLMMYHRIHNKNRNYLEVCLKTEINKSKSYLEVKRNGHKSFKHRKKFKIKDNQPMIPLASYDYMNRDAKYPVNHLIPVLNCEFNRYVFTNIKQDILVIIDSEIVFWNNNKVSHIPELAIVTIKTKDTSLDREIIKATKQPAILLSGLNKFSIGMALTNPELKQNLLKQKIRNIKKVCNEL